MSAFMLVVGCRSPAQAVERAAALDSRDARAAPEATARAAGVELFRSERLDAAGHRIVWVVVRADLSRVRPQIRRPPHARLENFASDPDVDLAINGGFFEADESPSGWLVSDGVTLAAPTTGGGSGFLVADHGRARLLDNVPGGAPVGVDFAVQCGPRLIERGGRTGMRGDDGKRAARTALCVRREGSELDFVLAFTRNSDRDGPTLYEMARWLGDPIVGGDPSGCGAALNLDGGPSTGLYVRGDPEVSRRSFGRVPFAVVLRADAPH